MSQGNNEERLFNVGFQRLGRWRIDHERLSYELTPDNDEARTRLKARAALYAFTVDDRVLYVGKTAMSLAERFAGYRSPGKDQSTNIRCHQAIRELLQAGREVQILFLAGLTPLRWGEFELNIAAGLEDSLILERTPSLNGGKRAITESEAIEREALIDGRPPENTPVQPAAPAPAPDASVSFQIELGETYYRQGIINPGSKAAPYIGAHGETMLLRLGADDERGIQTTINRRANLNGNPRLYGRSPVADWFQECFRLGDTVTARILGPHEIVLERCASAVEGRELPGAAHAPVGAGIDAPAPQPPWWRRVLRRN